VPQVWTLTETTPFGDTLVAGAPRLFIVQLLPRGELTFIQIPSTHPGECYVSEPSTTMWVQTLRIDNLAPGVSPDPVEIELYVICDYPMQDSSPQRRHSTPHSSLIAHANRLQRVYPCHCAWCLRALRPYLQRPSWLCTSTFL